MSKHARGPSLVTPETACQRKINRVSFLRTFVENMLEVDQRMVGKRSAASCKPGACTIPAICCEARWPLRRPDLEGQKMLSPGSVAVE